MITPFDAAADSPPLERFLALPDEVYRGDRHYLPPGRDAVLSGLRRPAFRDRQLAFLAEDSGAAVARVVARRSPALSDGQGRPIGMLGYFEALDRPEAVRDLLREAVAWLRASGAGTIVGPMDGDTWHKYRLNVGPYDAPPFLLEPYNSSYYPRLWADCGLVPLEEYYSTLVPDPAAAVARLAPILERIERRGYRLEPLRLSRFDAELRRLYELSREIFAGNFLYTEIAWDDFRNLYAATRALLDPELIWFARDPSGRDAGFLFCYPDCFAAVAALRGRSGWVGRLGYLLRKGRADAVNFKTLGVVSVHRRGGLGAALVCRGYQQTLKKGYRRANLCLIRQGNPSGSMDAGEGRLLRRYLLYQAP